MGSVEGITEIFFPLEVFYPSQAGGTANMIYWTTKKLAAHGYRSVIVATDKGIQSKVPLNKWIKIDGGRAIYVNTRFLNYPFRQTLITLLHFYRSDIIQISSIFFPTAFFAAIASRILQKKMILSPHGELDQLALTHSSGRKRPILWCLRKIIGTYPVFHSTCEAESVYIQKAFGDNAKIVLIPNYIEIPPLALRGESDYLLYIGRLHPKKAIDNLIRAVAMSEDFLRSNFILKIAGKGRGEYEKLLRKLVEDLNLQDKVVFVGQVEGQAKQELFASAYFTIMPSHTENCGIVVLESLAQETPVIASRGTPWQSLENERIGFWVDNVPEELARAIGEILRIDPSEYEGYRKRGRAFVSREYDISRNIDKWIAVYRTLA